MGATTTFHCAIPPHIKKTLIFIYKDTKLNTQQKNHIRVKQVTNKKYHKTQRQTHHLWLHEGSLKAILTKSIWSCWWSILRLVGKGVNMLLPQIEKKRHLTYLAIIKTDHIFSETNIFLPRSQSLSFQCLSPQRKVLLRNNKFSMDTTGQMCVPYLILGVCILFYTHPKRKWECQMPALSSHSCMQS